MTDAAPQNGSPERASAAAILALLGSRSIVLVGMMGVGKSSIGRRLAARLGVPFVDADAEIEKAAGMSIADIFARHSEADFRSGEARVIARLLDGGPQVLRADGTLAGVLPVKMHSFTGRQVPVTAQHFLTYRWDARCIADGTFCQLTSARPAPLERGSMKWR